MKKVLAIACLVALFIAATVIVASASELNWRLNIFADNGAGASGSYAQVGIKAGCKDPQPTDALPLSDAGSDSPWTIGLATAKTVASVFATDTDGNTPRAWAVDLKSTNQPWGSQYYDENYAPFYHKKVWSLRVAGAGEADTLTPIRLRIMTVSAAYLPSQTLTFSSTPLVKVPNKFWLKMVNNRGQEGAPANGTIWAIPIPTSHVTGGSVAFTLTLPTLNISVAKDEAKLISEGYVMEFYQTPEPSSLLALGAGLMGLAGFASKRRRS